MVVTAQLVDAAPSFCRLGPDSTLRRQILKPTIAAPAEFLAAFDETTLFYDCFWDAEGKRILLIGPPPLNLKREWKDAIFRALPSGVNLVVGRTVSLSQMVTILDGAPSGTEAISLTFGPHKFACEIRCNLAADFAQRRLLFSMNKDNDLAWIRQWAAHHVETQGTDAVALFDNASSKYGVEDIIETLRSVNGLKTIAVPSWPWAFGARDPRTEYEPFWSHFLQNCSMNVVLRRLGASAHSLLNVDVDELVWAGKGRSVHELAKTSRSGLLTFKGQWVEPIAAPDASADHRAFQVRLSESKARVSGANKWALDPARRWTQSLRIHPYWHWLQNRPWFSKEQRRDVLYWHFKGINTNWKSSRAVETRYDPAVHEQDPVLSKLWRDSAHLGTPVP
jgi:hypothetical protein